MFNSASPFDQDCLSDIQQRYAPDATSKPIYHAESANRHRKAQWSVWGAHGQTFAVLTQRQRLTADEHTWIGGRDLAEVEDAVAKFLGVVARRV